ncbi:MAG: NAD(P)-binding domain-containing protein [Acetobacteraceae bacterium]|nr:NAD(P)-binding domain-containing protein [Acetobacteraceae bacterium]
MTAPFRPNAALPVAIIGAGPVGLAAAAHALRRGMQPLILEAADDVAAHVRDYGHVRLFSPWRYNIDAEARALLEQAGWRAPDPDALPTGAELFEQYLKPLSELPPIARALKLGHRVVAVSRRGFDKVKTEGRELAPFVLRAEIAGGRAVELEASAVIDASGTWGQPNPLGANGLPAEGEREAASRIRYGIPDALGAERARYAGKAVLVVGSGHSAANALLDLAGVAGRLVWAIRGGDPKKSYGGGAADALSARGELGMALEGLVARGAVEVRAGFRVRRVEFKGDRLAVAAEDGRVVADVDEIVCATGQRPDLGMTRELRLRLDPWLECAEALGPLIDPNLHSCGTVRPHGARELAHPEPGFYTVGVKSYGRAPTFLLATGYEQVRSVAAMLAGDQAAALEVRLELPETGVCSATTASGAAACCGPAVDAAPRTTACCPAPQLAEAKAAGCCGPMQNPEVKAKAASACCPAAAAE